MERIPRAPPSLLKLKCKSFLLIEHKIAWQKKTLIERIPDTHARAKIEIPKVSNTQT